MVSVFILANGKWVMHWDNVTMSAAIAERNYLYSCGINAQIFRKV